MDPFLLSKFYDPVILVLKATQSHPLVGRSEDNESPWFLGTPGTAQLLCIVQGLAQVPQEQWSWDRAVSLGVHVPPAVTAMCLGGTWGANPSCSGLGTSCDDSQQGGHRRSGVLESKQHTKLHLLSRKASTVNCRDFPIACSLVGLLEQLSGEARLVHEWCLTVPRECVEGRVTAG